MIIDNRNKQYNKSAVFLLPMLDISISEFADFHNVYYKTVYDSEKRIYVVYDASIHINNYELIKSSKYYIKDYYVDNFRVIIFRVPFIYLEDFKLFCKGKYNSFSKRYKTLLLTVYKIKKTDLNKILNPSISDRNNLANKFNVNIKDISEIFPIPDEIEETFSISSNFKLEI